MWTCFSEEGNDLFLLLTSQVVSPSVIHSCTQHQLKQTWVQAADNLFVKKHLMTFNL